MKYLLSMETSDLSETHELKLAMNAVTILGAIQEYDNYLRGRLKYEENLKDDAAEALQAARDKLYEEFRDIGVSIWE